MDDYKSIVKLYFELGLSQDETLCFLAVHHRIIISKPTLKRTLKQLKLFRRKNYSDILDVALYVMRELQSAGQLHGYRWMHLKCIQAGFRLPRDTVYELMKILDPNGISLRRKRRLRRRQYFSKGPNYVWHVDSYDKLKPFGIAINGCIDGYSRNIIWLEANTTNSDPKVIACYFTDAVKRKNGCPQRIRADLGTENSYIEQMQVFLRRDHGDNFAGQRSFMYGKSTHNQRIEWFWGLLRKEMADCYISLFKRLTYEEDMFSGDFLDKSLIQYSFMKLIQEELDNVAAMWNSHSIASRDGLFKGANRPIMMYTLPELYSKEDCLCQVDADDVSVCEEHITPKPVLPCDETVKDLCNLLLEEKNLSYPTDIREAETCYKDLRRWIRSML